MLASTAQKVVEDAKITAAARTLTTITNPAIAFSMDASLSNTTLAHHTPVVKHFSMTLSVTRAALFRAFCFVASKTQNLKTSRTSLLFQPKPDIPTVLRCSPMIMFASFHLCSRRNYVVQR